MGCGRRRFQQQRLSQVKVKLESKTSQCLTSARTPAAGPLEMDLDRVGGSCARGRWREGRCVSHRRQRRLIELELAARAADPGTAQSSSGTDGEGDGSAAA